VDACFTVVSQPYISLYGVFTVVFRPANFIPGLMRKGPFLHFCASKNLSRVFLKALMFRRKKMFVLTLHQPNTNLFLQYIFENPASFFSGGGGIFYQFSL
jgi:hypothetical protein